MIEGKQGSPVPRALGRECDSVAQFTANCDNVGTSYPEELLNIQTCSDRRLCGRKRGIKGAEIDAISVQERNGVGCPIAPSDY